MSNPRRRARELGLKFGNLPQGPLNAITDVPGVRVGHSTIITGTGRHVPGRGPVRTGVTAVLPRDGNVFDHRVTGGGHVLNGAGEVSGLTQVLEWGLIETPIFLTNTLSVGSVSEAAVRYMVDANPEIGRERDVIIPVVGECDDSWLNDVAGHHVRTEHVYEAIDTASDGAVLEGNVGGGTGMMTCGFKSGIGTSSRILEYGLQQYSLGVLVMSNFGLMTDLRIEGLPMGEYLAPKYAHMDTRNDNYGSIIAVFATDAPLLPHQLCRVAKRVALGVGRAGSYAAHTSGEIVVGFSTANTVPRDSPTLVYELEILVDRRIDPLYQAAVDATEEAIINSLCAAETMDGLDGRVAPELPIDEVERLIGAFHAAMDPD